MTTPMILKRSSSFGRPSPPPTTASSSSLRVCFYPLLLVCFVVIVGGAATHVAILFRSSGSSSSSLAVVVPSSPRDDDDSREKLHAPDDDALPGAPPSVIIFDATVFGGAVSFPSSRVRSSNCSAEERPDNDLPPPPTETFPRRASARDARLFPSRNAKRRADDEQFMWFLHFHKAGGTSFSCLAAINRERLRSKDVDPNAMDDPHGHLELNRDGLCWDLVLSSSKNEEEADDDDVPKGCIPPRMAREPNGKVGVLEREIASLMARRVTFASTKHWFPNLAKTPPLPPAVAPIVIFREPLEWLVLSYNFHDRGSGRCRRNNNKRETKCPFEEWSKAESNLYIKMLNGRPFGPMILPRSCMAWYGSRPVGEKEYQTALDNLKRFHLVLTLKSVAGGSNSKAAAECALNQVLGWDRRRMPRLNERKMKKRGRREPIEDRAMKKARRENRWDLKLYEEARKLETKVFRTLGCV